jgi:hypothetical protein
MHALKVSARVTPLNYRVCWQSPEGGLLYQVSGGGLMILNADGTGYGVLFACLVPALRKRVWRARSQIALSLHLSLSPPHSLPPSPSLARSLALARALSFRTSSCTESKDNLISCPSTDRSSSKPCLNPLNLKRQIMIPTEEEYDDADFDEEGVLITSASKGKMKSKAAKKVN